MSQRVKRECLFQSLMQQLYRDSAFLKGKNPSPRRSYGVHFCPGCRGQKAPGFSPPGDFQGTGNVQTAFCVMLGEVPPGQTKCGSRTQQSDRGEQRCIYAISSRSSRGPLAMHSAWPVRTLRETPTAQEEGKADAHQARSQITCSDEPGRHLLSRQPSTRRACL